MSDEEGKRSGVVPGLLDEFLLFCFFFLLSSR